MKSNKITIISSLFLMTALCGCTTQSVDKAKEIEESNTYVYKYEYETNTEGQAETQYHEEKPSFDDFETVTKGTIASLRNKNGSLKLIKMNEVYEWGGMECSIAEAHMTTNVDYADEILDDNVLDPCKEKLKRIYPTGKSRVDNTKAFVEGKKANNCLSIDLYFYCRFFWFCIGCKDSPGCIFFTVCSFFFNCSSYAIP